MKLKMQKLGSELGKMFARRRDGRILAVETDDLVIRAAEVRITRHSVAVEGVYATGAIELSTGLKDIAGQIRARGATPPREAVILSPQVYATVLSIPVDTARELAYSEMRELVRWELEPYLARNKGRKIGAILVGRGHLKGKDLEWVLELLEKQKAGDAGHVQRFGEIALTANLIKREHLDEALTIQQSFQDFAGDAVCGWIPLPGAPVDGKWRWLAAGVFGGYRDHLVGIFAENGIELKAIYPLVGSAGACLNGTSGTGNAIFEYHSGFLAYTRIDNRAISNCHYRFTHEAGNPLRHCFDLFEPDAERVWLSGVWPNPETAREKIAACLERPCAVLATDTERDGRESPLHGICGAVRHYAKIANPKSAVGIATKDPRPPLANNWVFRVCVLAGCVTLAMLTYSIYLRHRRFEFENRIEIGIKEAEFGKTLSELGVQKSQALRLRDFYARDIAARKNLLPGLLAAIKRTCPHDVVIDRLSEDNAGTLSIEGWSASLGSIRAFRIALDRALDGCEISDKNHPVRLAANFSELPGYGFRFDVTPRAGRTP